MKKKDSEKYLATMMRHYAYWAHKWRDRGYVTCPNCHQLATKCPNCKKDMLLPKAQTRADYSIIESWADVECKQGEESWALNDFTEGQEERMANFGSNESQWVFLVLGTGRAPEGKEAYLIHLRNFLTIRERLYGEGFKSVRFRKTERSKVPEAREVFCDEDLCPCLDWKTGTGWTIPKEHLWWSYHTHLPDEVFEEFKDEKKKEITPNADTTPRSKYPPPPI